ncbi:MAG: hypothetical protein WAN48_08450 [Actinomycetes bacterium]
MSKGASRPSTDRAFVVHIGPRKTGTSSIQHALRVRREVLREHGVVYPGTGLQHHGAVNAFLGRRQVWEEDLTTEVRDRPWRGLLRELGKAPVGVVSTEVLSQARTEDIRRLLDSARDRAPTVVVTYRPFEELVPSTWQQLVKEGLREPLDTWARAAVTDHPELTGARFPRVLDLATLVETWGSVVGMANVAVVLVDRTRPRAIFQAFERLLAVPEDLLVTKAGPPRKRSFSAEEAELVRQTNLLLPRDEAAFDRYRVYRKRVLAKWLNDQPPSHGDTKLVLPPDVIDLARRRSEQMVAQIEALPVGPQVFGDLSTLVPQGPLPDGAPATVTRVDVTLAAQLLAGAVMGSRGSTADPRADGSDGSDGSAGPDDADG